MDRNCDTHADPAIPGNKTKLIIHGINRLFMAPHLRSVRDWGRLKWIFFSFLFFENHRPSGSLFSDCPQPENEEDDEEKTEEEEEEGI